MQSCLWRGNVLSEGKPACVSYMGGRKSFLTHQGGVGWSSCGACHGGGPAREGDHRHSGLPDNKSLPQEQKDEHRKTKEQPQEEADG